MNAKRAWWCAAMLAAAAFVRGGESPALAAPSAPDRATRVFVASFPHETNTFHPQKTTSFSFSTSGAGFSLPGWKDAGLVTVAGVSARPNGGGTIEEGPCREAMNRVLQSLREAMPVQAVFLRLHGAMYAEGIGPAETVLVGEVRAIVGRTVPIACTFDLHGNIPARLGDFGDILVGLKTAPHTDAGPTAELAGRILLDTLQGRVRPVSYVLPIPIIVQGEKAMTTSEPFRSLVEEARRVEKEGVPGHPEKILAATLFVGCAWTDSPDTGMAVMITADGSRKAARAAAVHLARKIWEARDKFAFGCETAELDEGITRAVEAADPKVLLTDSGDNVTASTPGDLPIVLRRLIERKVERALVFGIHDPRSIERCVAAGEGATVRLSLGAFMETRFGPPLEADAQVVRLVNARRAAVVRIGGVTVVLGAPFFRSPEEYAAFGLDSSEYKIIVTKCGYRYASQAAIASRHIMLMTPGTGDMRIERLTYTRRRHPAFPFERDTRFDPAAAPE